MAREFKILDKDNVDWLFLDKFARNKGYISYRHVIEHALFELLKSHDIDEIKTNFFSLYAKYKNVDNIDDQKNLISIYFLKQSDKHAALVDHTKWCFPLVCDTDSRAYGLQSAIKNIVDQIGPILEELEKNRGKKWDLNIQNEMDKFDDRNPELKTTPNRPQP